MRRAKEAYNTAKEAYNTAKETSNERMNDHSPGMRARTRDLCVGQKSPTDRQKRPACRAKETRSRARGQMRPTMAHSSTKRRAHRAKETYTSGKKNLHIGQKEAQTLGKRDLCDARNGCGVRALVGRYVLHGCCHRR